MYNYDLMSEEFKIAGEYLMELIRAALTGTQAKEKPENILWEQVYRLAKMQSVESVSAYGVDTLKEKPEAVLQKDWQEKKNRTLFKVLHFDMEREQILAEMAAKGLSFLPLKGVLIETYYPQPGMRSMADNDILYGLVEKTENGYRIVGENSAEQEKSIKRAQKLMVEIMKKRGYEVKSLVGAHDTYLKKPFYNYEMHRKLMSSISSHRDYYVNSWERAIADSEGSYGYHFSDEDEYLYFLAHAYKHFDRGGCGVRLLNDVYVFNKKKSASMDRKYLEQELKKLNLIEFEKNITGLVQAIFVENRVLDEKERELLHYLFGCGTYGRSDVCVMNGVDKFEKGNERSKLKVRLLYIKQRFFIDEEIVKEWYPFFYKRPYLKPLLPVYRMVRGIIIHPGQLIGEWKNIWKKNKK